MYLVSTLNTISFTKKFYEFNNASDAQTFMEKSCDDGLLCSKYWMLELSMPNKKNNKNNSKELVNDEN